MHAGWLAAAAGTAGWLHAPQRALAESHRPVHSSQCGRCGGGRAAGAGVTSCGVGTEMAVSLCDPEASVFVNSHIREDGEVTPLPTPHEALISRARALSDVRGSWDEEPDAAAGPRRIHVADRRENSTAVRCFVESSVPASGTVGSGRRNRAAKTAHRPTTPPPPGPPTASRSSPVFVASVTSFEEHFGAGRRKASHDGPLYLYHFNGASAS